MIIIIIVMIIIIILISWGFTPRGFPNVNCSGWNRQCHDHNHQIIVKCIIGMRIAWELWACVLAIWAGSPSWSPWLPYNEKCLEVGDDLLLIMFLWWSLVIYTVLSWISPIKKNKICLFSDLETSNPIGQTKYLGSHWGHPWISIFDRSRKSKLWFIIINFQWKMCKKTNQMKYQITLQGSVRRYAQLRVVHTGVDQGQRILKRRLALNRHASI